MADAYDFQIDTLKFRLATSDKFPYVRSTAPFRKEQFDSAPTVGDQSLSGWWTRGQLSFHKGAGLKYYEVLDGDEVLSRYQSSENVLVFTPGEVTLQPLVNEWTMTDNVTRAMGTRPDGLYIRDFSNLLRSVDRFTGAITSYSATAPETGFMGTACASSTHIYARTTPNDKIEKFKLSSSTSAGLIYDHSQFIDGMWYAKDRLWVLDRDGKLYAVTGSPSGALPATLGSPVLTIPQGDASFDQGIRADLTEVGPGVLMSFYSEDIYFIGLDSSGSVPTLASPVVVATLPQGEYVCSLRHYLGLLVIVTTHGVRVAQVSDSGTVTYGPLVIAEHTQETFSSRQVSCVEQSVAFTHCRRDEYGSVFWSAYEMDLSQPLPSNPLLFPWRRIMDIGIPGSTWHGATEVNGRHAWWSDTVIYYPGGDPIESTGWIRTAFHRFGTLDKKQFRKVTVRASGSHGTIAVYQISDNEVETLLGQMNTSDGVGTFDFALTDAAERVALKFVLTATHPTNKLSNNGPRLLGYQIKALPVPVRQHLLKVPLMIQDNLTLRRGTQVGRQGKAYDDIKALEALESSSAVVTYTDHRTGETGEAYIDQVDFQSDTPASPTTNGFGGIAYVTLRVID